MTTNDSTPPTPPAALPADPARFWNSPTLAELPPAPAPPAQSALEALGPSPFPRNKFPFLGFLASVCDHIAGIIKGRNGT